MGSFAITYDDFSGGHYMGNKAAALPKNTWYGTNAILNPKGELIPGESALVHTFTNPNPNWDAATIHYGYTSSQVTSFVVSWYEYGVGTTSQILNVSVVNNAVFSTSTTTLTGEVDGQCTVATDSSGGRYLFYVDVGTYNIRKVDSFGADTLVSSALALQLPSSITDYKYRLLAWGNSAPSKLFYSDNTKTSFSTGDYYEFDGAIEAVVPRSNDVVVITSEGIYSITGVFGSSVNIQLIAPPNELLQGMESAKASGRSVYFVNEGSFPISSDNRLYELLGATTREVARIGVEDTNLAKFDRIGMNVIEGGNVAIAVSNGAIYIMRQDGTFVRMFNSRANFTGQSEAYIAEPRHSFLGTTNYLMMAVTQTDGDVEIHHANHESPYPCPEFGTTTPAQATVVFPEYWHQKPMTVRDLLVEVVYDAWHNHPSYLVGDATITASITPTGAVDYGVTAVPSLSSSQQTYTTSLSSVAYNETAVLHRFRVDDAVKAYGFKPKIVFAGCRIRRVIAVCED